jgi:hypothetical protein
MKLENLVKIKCFQLSNKEDIMACGDKDGILTLLILEENSFHVEISKKFEGGSINCLLFSSMDDLIFMGRRNSTISIYSIS